ncbi:MAG: hypothetical protein ACFCGT_19095 [Sandaracinaceae bacterium]
MTSTEEQTTSFDEAQRRMEEAAAKAQQAVHRIGRLWAAHGLDVGRSALEATSETLKATADLLEEMSKRVAEEVDRAKASSEAPDDDAPASSEG